MPNALALYLQRTSLCLVASLGSNGSHFTSLQGHEHSYSLKKASHVSFFSVCFFTSFVPFFCYLPDPVSTQSSNCVFMCCLHLQWTRDMQLLWHCNDSSIEDTEQKKKSILGNRAVALLYSCNLQSSSTQNDYNYIKKKTVKIFLQFTFHNKIHFI